MDTSAKLTKAKSQLLISHPYFGMLASRLKDEPTEGVSRFASNGKIFKYNPMYISECTIDEMKFVLAHCVMHHILAHQQRKEQRYGWLWQLATDIAINQMLLANKFVAPQGVYAIKEFEKMYAEEIYDALLKQLDQGSADNAFEGSDQSKRNYLKEELLPEDADLDSAFANYTQEGEMDEQEESAWYYAASMAKDMASRQSEMPSGLERLSVKQIQSKSDWRYELYNAINRHMKNNYAFMPPNKKMLAHGVILPSLTSDTLSLAVAIDTSGSINDELLAAFMSEFKEIMETFPDVAIDLIIADAKVHGHYTFQGGEKLEYTLKGGGGTDFRPTFEYIDANIQHTSMLLYFTDGDGRFPKWSPNYEVLWALSRKAKIPWGRELLLN